MAGFRFEFHQLRCFVAVAEELNFSRAADRLNMTQPPLSRQIRLLEEGLGLTLLERSTRTVRLTMAGESFLASAVDLLQRAEYATLLARQAERGEVGSVALGFVPSAALTFVPRIVAAVARDLPDVSFRPTEMMSYEIVEALRSGGLDMGLTRMPEAGPEIETVHVVRDSFVLALPRGHRFETAPAVTVEDLDGEPFVGYAQDRGGYLRDVHMRLFGAFGVMPTPVQEVSQTHSVLALVNGGVGIGLVPSSSQAMRMDNLAYREIGIPDRYTSDLYLAIAPRRRAALRARVRDAVVSALADYLPRPAATDGPARPDEGGPVRSGSDDGHGRSSLSSGSSRR